uniref:WAT1-related protein At5g47470-like n=1 Tax=Rhizophora mucronata TaxID=61149 RepID=A0A2P2MV82_RHIMU
MAWYKKKEVLEDFAIIVGLIGVQFVYAANSMLLSYLMSLGLSPLTIVIFSTFATFLIISPVALYFERSLSLLPSLPTFLSLLGGFDC